MIKLVIDGKTVVVAEGVTVLQAAQSVGIPIPHFCWHPALGKAGACRLCAVKMLDGPIKGVQMSCMLDCQNGMVVSTTDPDALDMRRQVIEWLMINHPHDCPVCDEGGECLLQDFTIAGGHGIRRYTGKKRTYLNQYLGTGIAHEMNRCIQCYRCVRFYQEFAGGKDFGALGVAQRVFFGRAENGQLESPFSGNLADICPTGVFTDKTARYRARYWDYDMAPSVCPHCSLGCNTFPACRYRELLKVIARKNDAINGWFICDRGRFSKAGVNDADRPREPRVDGRHVAWNEALEQLVVQLTETGKFYGRENLAIVGSSRLSMEAATLLHTLQNSLGAGSLCYFISEEEATRTGRAVSCLNEKTSASMVDVQAAELIVIIACHLLRDGPMMALAVRQAWRRGARVFLLDEQSMPEAGELPFAWEAVTSLADIPLQGVKKKVVVCGTGDRAARLIPQALANGARLACLLDGPNSFGAALLAGDHGATPLAEAVAAGKVKGILAVEADIPPELLRGIPFIAALDWRNTEVVRAARIVLPTTAWVEMDGTYINNEGRAQRFKKAMNPGLPITGLNPAGLHPPRHHIAMAPGSDVRPAWEILREIVERLGTKGAKPLAGKWERLRDIDPEAGGHMVFG